MVDMAKSRRESNSSGQIAVSSQCIRQDRDVTELTNLFCFQHTGMVGILVVVELLR